jgi:hypothetical protein
MSTFGNVSGRSARAARACVLVACAVLLWLAVPATASAAPTWARTWKPRSGSYTIYQVRLAPAPAGGVYVGTTPCSASHVASGMAVARYTPGGKRLWGKLLTKASRSAVAAVAADPSGRLVVAGAAPTAAGGTKWRLLKLSRAGKVLWHTGLMGVAKAGSGPSGLSVDGAGHIYVCGAVGRSGRGSDASLAKFSAGGKLLWIRYLGGSAHGDDFATGLARDSQGHIYVAGHVSNVGTGYDAFVARYSPTGHRAWRRFWDNLSTHGDDDAWAVAASSAGVAVAGSTDGAWDTGYNVYDRDGLVVSYTPSGGGRYEYTVAGTSPSGEFAAAYIDGAGNVVAAGRISTGASGSGNTKAVLLMLSPAGTEWYSSWLPIGPGDGGFEAITSRGGTLVAVGFESAGSGSDMLLHTVTPSLVTTVDSYSSGAGTTNDATDVLCRGSAIYLAGGAGVKMGLVGF